MRILSHCLLLILSAAALSARAEELILEPIIDLGVIPMPRAGGIISLPQPTCGVGELGFEIVQLNNEFDGASGRNFPLGPPGSRDFVIRTERRWCEWWQIAHSHLETPPPCNLSLVDFSTELVIATTRSGEDTCHGVAVKRIEQVPGTRDIDVIVSDVNPGAECLCGPAFVWPIQAVIVAEPVGRVTFVHQQTVVSCEQLVFGD